jgi:hypothetical protein
MTAKDYIPDWFLKEQDEGRAAVQTAIAGMTAAINDDLLEVIVAAKHRNCFYCMHFQHADDVCLVARPPSRPPTFILVHGCRSYHHEDNIPY